MRTIKTSETPSGRKFFIDDLLALQDNAKALVHIFDVCDKNFVISGCSCTIGSSNQFTIGSGYVYINGEICYFEGYSGTKTANTSFTLKRQDTSINDVYKDGFTDAVYVDSKAIFSGSETDVSVLSSDKASGAVTGTLSGNTVVFPTISSEFFDKYCITKSSSASGGVVQIGSGLKASSFVVGNCVIEETANGGAKISIPSTATGKRVYLLINSTGSVYVRNENGQGSASIDVFEVCANGKVITPAIENEDEDDPVSIPKIESESITSTGLNASNIIVGTSILAPLAKIDKIERKSSNNNGFVEIPKLKATTFSCDNMFTTYELSGDRCSIVFKVMNGVVHYYGTITNVLSGENTSTDMTAGDYELSSNNCYASQELKTFFEENTALIPSGTGRKVIMSGTTGSYAFQSTISVVCKDTSASSISPTPSIVLRDNMLNSDSNRSSSRARARIATLYLNGVYFL